MASLPRPLPLARKPVTELARKAKAGGASLNDYAKLAKPPVQPPKVKR